MLAQLKNDQEGMVGRKKKILVVEARELIRFMERWESLAKEHLIEALVCPGEVESHLESIKMPPSPAAIGPRSDVANREKTFCDPLRLFPLFETLSDDWDKFLD
jgi:hypothetical protein